MFDDVIVFGSIRNGVTKALAVRKWSSALVSQIRCPLIIDLNLGRVVGRRQDLY